MDSNPCKVCGGTDLNLVDGFYYCVECGTQDVNVRETVVEQTVLADGTFAHITTKKFTTVAKNAIEMTPEWNKWHAYNFILAGLTDELLQLGAERSVKTVILWIWTRYVKMFQVKDDEQNDNASLNETINSYLEDKQDNSDDDLDKSSISSKSSKKKNKSDKFRWDIKIVTKGTLLTILYIALNLDRSDIQLSHLLRFIKEGRLSLYNCTKFVPEDINTKSIPHWKNFILCQNDYTAKIIRTIAMTFFKRLNLGVPLVPNLNRIVTNYVKELCLPSDFKKLVLAIMNLSPCDFLKLDTRTKKSLVRIPDYEGVCMSYVLVALKMCFGLDSDYELKVSEEVDRINYIDNHCKSYKIGSYSDPTDRLFSFQDWYKFLLFRKTILCKYYLPMARLYKLPIDECVLMEQLKERNQRPIKLSDNVTMDILNKIGVSNNVNVIPKKEFPATLTPMTTYTEVILQYQQDPDFRLLLSEDFSQYSLKYAICDLKLPGFYEETENLIHGVSETNKTINHNVIGTLHTKTGDSTMVFVRNCENKNWLKTKPPTLDHVTKVLDEKSNSDKESDHGYDSNIDSTPVETDETQIPVNEEFPVEKIEENIFETIDEEKEGICIFDDNLSEMDIWKKDKKDKSILEPENSAEFQNDANDFQDSKENLHESLNELTSANKDSLIPDNFDRNLTIRKLLEIACQKYKIKPSLASLYGNETRDRRKRKNIEDVVNTQQSQVKRIRREARTDIKELVNIYYRTVEKNDLDEVIKNVNSGLDNPSNEEIISDTFPKNNEHNDFEESKIENDNGEDCVHDDVGKDQSMISSIYPNSIMNNICKDNEYENEEEIEDLITQPDPKFDPKTHEIDQLYVKLNKNDNVDINNSLNYDSDPEFNDIIDRNLEEFRKFKKEQAKASRSDSEDDLPLSDLANEKSFFKKNRLNSKYENLISNPDLQMFNYWMRHYRSRAVSRSLDMNEKFDIEIMENCPKSFVFIIRECAAILDCTTFTLYKCMQNLEETLLRYCDP